MIIIQARMTSTRLPGKILKNICGKPMLELQVERLRQIHSAPEIWIATTTNKEDEPTVELAKKLRIPFFRGSEHDVLSRYYECAKTAKATWVMRVTADCPLIDPDVLEEILKLFTQAPDHYVQNVVERTYPRGLDAEVFAFEALEDAYKNALSPTDREHVTPYIRKKYPAKTLCYASSNLAQHRWTVDTPEDFELIRRIFEAIYPTNSKFRLKDVLQILARHPEWSELNAGVTQKTE
jgi:spore coat polysaccharide biosynthesis protein SpsF